MARIQSHVVELNISAGGVEWLGVPAWRGLGWLWHGFSTRRGGVSRVYLAPDQTPDQTQDQTQDLGNELPGELNLGFTAADEAENVRENRLRLVAAVTGSREIELVTVRQVHSAVSVLARVGVEGGPAEADGLMTDRDGILLGIQTADCVPVLVVDPVQRAVAGFHAGWRGTVAGIVEAGVAQMRDAFGSEPARLLAAIGPGIGACCYTVGNEVREAFEARFSYGSELLAQDEAGLRLDLIEANRRQLLSAGVAAGSIAVVGGCTNCQPERFFSHRGSGGHAGRMMAAIGMRPED